MKILCLNAYFEPEITADTHLEHDLLEAHVKEGNEVFLICPTPTRGISKETIKEYTGRKKEELFDGHVHVRRFYAPQEGQNPISRALRYFWCNLRTYQAGKKSRGVDVVYSNSTPPTQGWIAGKVARRLKVPFVYSLQDIFPDTLVSSGLTEDGSLLWKIGRKIEKATYAGSSSIITINRAMENNLLKKGVEKEKIKVISNWIDAESIQPVERSTNKLFDEFGIERSRFIVLYAGNLGESQGAEAILDAADKLKEENNIQFVIFGAGALYETFAQKAKNMKNVFIHPLLPQARVPEVYSMGDVALITCKKGVGTSAMPSKLWSILACNTRTIAAFDLDSELCEQIRSMDAGLCVEPENADALAEAILEEMNSGSGKNHDLRPAVIRTASKEICTSSYLRVIREAVDQRKQRG